MLIISSSALWKLAPCLVTGNVMIFKPSEVTPLTALILAEILTTAGLPPGVFTVLHGGPSIGATLTSSPHIAKVSFTGQPSTGIKVYQSAASHLSPVTLELGGKSPFIVFPDANLTLAVRCCMTANFYSSGQVCTNGTRVFVHSSIFERFSALLKTEIEETIRAGDPLDANTNFGPVVSQAQYDKVRSYISHGLSVDRATLLVGGLDPPPNLPSHLQSGFFVTPTVFTDVTDSMRIAREEIFGPVACLLKFETKEEVVRRANDTELGLAAGVFTKDLNLAHEVIDEINAGICWVNTWGESPAEMPVGGWGMSGLGVENGVEALEQWRKGKSVLVEHGEVGAAFVRSEKGKL